MEIKTLVIDRSKWHRGESPKGSALLLEDGSMCCLGFYCKALGKTDAELLNVTAPDRVGVRGWLGEKYAGGERDVDHVLMSINDSTNLGVDGQEHSEALRETNIAAIFHANGGIEVTFV